MIVLSAMIIVFVVALLIGVPVAFCVGLSSLVALVSIPYLTPNTLAIKLFTGLDSFPLVAGLFFILAGEIMSKGGITNRLMKFAEACVGRIRGGLAHTNVLASMLFAGLSGSAVADTAALGPLEIGMMTEAGYDVDFSTAVTVASSVIGPIIPPSVIGIIYATCAGTSVAGLLLAGIIPGILLGVSLMILCYYFAVKRDYPRGNPITLKEFWDATVHALPALVLPLIIIGGVLTGMFTVTEAGSVAAAYALIVVIVGFRSMSLKDLAESFVDAASSVGSCYLVISTAAALSYIFAIEEIPTKVLAALAPAVQFPWLFLLLLLVLLLVVGTFMDPGAAILILVPVLLPTVKSLGLSELHLGMIVVLTLAIGVITPPVGVCLYVGCSIAKISIEQLTKSLWPFLLAEILVVLLVTYIPWLSTWIPSLFGFR